MVLAKPRRWLHDAAISLLGSLLGALVGYALGHYAFEALRPLLAEFGWLPHIDALCRAAHARTSRCIPGTRSGLLVIAGFMPIPLKFFTWASGIVGVPLPAFLAACSSVAASASSCSPA